VARDSSPDKTLEKQEKEVDAKMEEMMYRSSLLPSTAPGKYAIYLLSLLTDQFTFADSLPCHARARPMQPIT
jgi:hypothetical protein